MGRLADWLWQRYRRRYLVVATVGCTILGIGGVGLPVSVALLPFLGVSSRSVIAAGVIGLGFEVLLGVLTTVSLLGRLRPIALWGAGAEVDPAEVWDVALQAPRIIARRAAVVIALGQHLVLVPGLAPILDLSWSEVWAFELAFPLAEALGALVVGVGARFLFRPLVEEVSPLVPAAARPSGRDWPLSGRMLLTGWLVSVVACAVGALSGTTSDEFSGPLLRGLLLGAVVAGVGVAIMAFGMLGPSLRPLRDLTDAAQRVEQGNFSLRVPVTSADEMGDLVLAFNAMQQGLVERESLHAAFGSYVDPVLAERLLATGSSVFEGEELDVTVMFADVRSFTTYSEGVSPTEAVGLLNRLFDVLVPVIHEHGGHANHYLGDGLLAVFGAPQPLPGHADAAVAAAVEIQQRVRTVLGDELQIGIGINSGPVIAGTVGGGGRLEFTVIGDTVNAAARVEELTKETGDAILVTEATWKALSAPRPRTTKRGEFEIRGKATKLTLRAVNPSP